MCGSVSVPGYPSGQANPQPLQLAPWQLPQLDPPRMIDRQGLQVKRSGKLSREERRQREPKKIERETIPKGRKSEVTKRVEMVEFDIQITFGALPKIIDVELSGRCDRKHIVSGEGTETGKGRFGADERNAIKKSVPAIERRRFSPGRRCHWKLPVHTPSAQTLNRRRCRRRRCYVHFLSNSSCCFLVSIKYLRA